MFPAAYSCVCLALNPLTVDTRPFGIHALLRAAFESWLPGASVPPQFVNSQFTSQFSQFSFLNSILNFLKSRFSIFSILNFSIQFSQFSMFSILTFSSQFSILSSILNSQFSFKSQFSIFLNFQFSIVTVVVSISQFSILNFSIFSILNSISNLKSQYFSISNSQFLIFSILNFNFSIFSPLNFSIQFSIQFQFSISQFSMTMTIEAPCDNCLKLGALCAGAWV